MSLTAIVTPYFCLVFNWSWSGFYAGVLSGPGSHHAVPSLGREVGFSLIYSWPQGECMYDPSVSLQFYDFDLSLSIGSL